MAFCFCRVSWVDGKTQDRECRRKLNGSSNTLLNVWVLIAPRSSFESSLHYNSPCCLHCTMKTVMTSLCVYELNVVSEMQ